MQIDLDQWYDKQNQGEVLLAYKGEVTASLISNVLETIEMKLDSIAERVKMRKKLYNVLVESLQNLYHHTAETPGQTQNNLGAKFAMFIVKKEANHYHIVTGNFIKVERKKMLKDRLDQINFLNKDELKSLYKLILSNEEFSDKGGGGLGMIDIRRKSGNKLDYHFYDYNNEYFFFTLEVNI